MSKQVMLEDDVLNKLKNRAVQLDMVFSSLNDVLRVILNMTEQIEVVHSDCTLPISITNYPSSKIPKVQGLLNNLKETIFDISKNGLKKHSNKRWVADPNIVTITVQEARARNLRITVYGRPDEFESIKPLFAIKDDMSGYSRFKLDNESQLPSAIKVINHSFDLKKQRGRL
jgi:hypothetical protein